MEQEEKEKKSKEKKPEDESTFVVKPNITNALFPIFLKNLFYSAIFCAVLFGIYMILNFLDITIISVSWSVAFFIVLALILALIPLASKIFVLAFTKYEFHDTNVVKEFRFIIIKKRSVIYSRITNVSLEISLWDRICRAGDITLHTDDEDPDIVLQYVKKPEELEHRIYSMIKAQNKNTTQNQL